jgi:formate dehydrogenase maturation protein FdhE
MLVISPRVARRLANYIHCELLAADWFQIFNAISCREHWEDNFESLEGEDVRADSCCGA